MSPETIAQGQDLKQRDGAGPAVCAIVVTYNPDRTVLEAVLDAVARQVSAIVVVDNGSESATTHWLGETARQWIAHLILLAENLGLGVAHNRGIEWARRGGYTHVLILDQDSVPMPDMVEVLLGASRRLCSEGNRVSAVGPRYLDPVSGWSSFFVRFGKVALHHVFCDREGAKEVIAADFLISSGMLVSMEAVDEIGGMDEALFIDHVDTEWFLRARGKGFSAFGVCGAVMTHRLGDEKVRVWLGRWRSVAIRSPLRHYYAVRNSILLYRRPYSPGIWILNDTLRIIQLFCFHSLFGTSRLEHAGMMLKGVWHGILGRSGRLR